MNLLILSLSVLCCHAAATPPNFIFILADDMGWNDVGFTGANACRVPLNPVPAKQPQSIRGEFLRGAIAIAANGIPIFNPQNNRGEISLDIGELDEWGGACLPPSRARCSPAPPSVSFIPAMAKSFFHGPVNGVDAGASGR